MITWTLATTWVCLNYSLGVYTHLESLLTWSIHYAGRTIIYIGNGILCLLAVMITSSLYITLLEYLSYKAHGIILLCFASATPLVYEIWLRAFTFLIVLPFLV